MTSSLHFAQLKFWFRLDISRCSGPETLPQVLSSEICKISKNAFSYGTHLVAASGFPSIYRLLQVSLVNFKAFSKVAINVTFWLLTIWIKKSGTGKRSKSTDDFKSNCPEVFSNKSSFWKSWKIHRKTSSPASVIYKLQA